MDSAAPWRKYMEPLNAIRFQFDPGPGPGNGNGNGNGNVCGL